MSRNNSPATDALPAASLRESYAGPVADDHELTYKARAYGESVIRGSTWPLDNVQLSKVTWATWTTSKRKHGRCNSTPFGYCRIEISEHTYENAGFEACKETIRHELVHAWQHQNGHPCDHGDSFRQWVAPLDLQGRCAHHYDTDQHAPYKIYCPNCGLIAGYFRRCKSVAAAVRGRSYCDKCGRVTQGDLWVETDGQRLTQNELCDNQTGSPHIQLAMKTGRVRTREGTVIDKRSSMLTMALTELPGIGAKTAQKLEDNCDRIEDLLNDTKTGLAEPVRETVPTQYQPELRRTVLNKYRDALAERSTHYAAYWPNRLQRK